MRKFFVLLKKEIKELLTPQMLIPFIAIILVFMFVGKVIGKENEKQIKQNNIAVIDLDNSQTSTSIIDSLGQVGFSVTKYDMSVESTLSELKLTKNNVLVVIPTNFENGIKNGNVQQVDVYTILRNFTFMGSKDSQNAGEVVVLINENLSNYLIAQNVATGADLSFLKSPVKPNPYVIVGEKEANADPAQVLNFVSSQTTFIPIVLFLVITLASQLVAVGIATEKENKTLETLLSTPVSRKAIVAAKLVAAGIVSLLTATAYLFGMQSYMKGMTGNSVSLNADSDLHQVLEKLDLTFSTSDYVLLGLCLFAGILAALSIAFILGSFAEDSKGAQTVTSPLMIMLLLPYFLTLMVDVSSLSPALKIFINAIPFTHTFLAAPNILLRNYTGVFAGIGYLAIIIIAGIYLASRLFSSEKILTMKLRLGKRR